MDEEYKVKNNAEYKLTIDAGLVDNEGNTMDQAKTITFRAPQVKYYSNVTGGELTDFSNMPELLAKHIVSPVRFTSELNQMKNDGADIFAEFGPGKTLTGLVKKTLSDVKAFNIENTDTLEGAEIYG